MDPLLRALSELGARVRPAAPGRSLPFRIEGPLSAGTVTLPGSVSSQFLSGLLFALAGLPSPSRVRVQGPQVSQPYVEASLRVLGAFGVRIQRGRGWYGVPGNGPFRPVPMEIPADASSAAYLFAGAALSGGTVRVGPFPVAWPQADLAVLPVLRAVGARVVRRGNDWEVSGGPLPLRPFRADLDASPDLAPLLAVLASFGRGVSRLTGGAQLVHKESDRRRGTEALVRSLGARLRRSREEWAIQGPPSARKLRRLTLSDHRRPLLGGGGRPRLTRALDARTGVRRRQVLSPVLPGPGRPRGRRPSHRAEGGGRLRMRFGEALQVTVFGSSHGPDVGSVVEGLPAGLPVDLTGIQAELDRRSPVGRKLATRRAERDQLILAQGVSGGRTTGGPVVGYVRNEDVRRGPYRPLEDVPRPGHADYPARERYGGSLDLSGGGIFSGRMTVGLVLAGALVRPVLTAQGVSVVAFTRSIHGISVPEAALSLPLSALKA
ncbi:Chorismate synthase, partial [mine drainage metagenome]